VTISGRSLYGVVFVGAETAPVVSRIGISVLPDQTFNDATQFDLVIVVASYDQDLKYKKQFIA